MKLTESEIKLMHIIWQLEPVGSGQLVKLCNEQFEWKKSTTYTFLKRLQERNAVKNENTFVSTLITKEEFQKEVALDIVDTVFDGDFIKFTKAYLQNKSLTTNDLAQLKEVLGLEVVEERKFVRFEV